MVTIILMIIAVILFLGIMRSLMKLPAAELRSISPSFALFVTQQSCGELDPERLNEPIALASLPAWWQQKEIGWTMENFNATYN